MLPIENRLKNTNDFGKVYEKGRFFSSGGLTVRFIPNALAVSRIGFSVSKSVFKKATLRNRIRRLLREAMRLKMPHVRPGFDIVISYSAKDKDPKFAQIAGLLDHILKKCHLVN